jgi:hypothetical protein
MGLTITTQKYNKKDTKTIKYGLNIDK